MVLWVGFRASLPNRGRSNGSTETVRSLVRLRPLPSPAFERVADPARGAAGAIRSKAALLDHAGIH